MIEAGKRTGISTGEILYSLFFCSLLLAKGAGFYDGQIIFKLVLIFAAGCLGLKICMEKYTLWEYVKMAVIIGLTAVTYLNSGEKGLLLYGMMMIGMKHVDVKRLFKLGTLIWTASFLVTVISALFHMEDTVFKVHDKLGMGHIVRWSLGYPHPNVLQVSYLILAMFILYILGDRFRLKHALWLFAGNCLVFLYSVSYTGFIMFLCLMAGRIYVYFRKRLCVAEKILLQLVYPVCVFLSLVAPVKMKQQWFDILNELLSHRLELAWRYLKPEFLSLFGIRVADITTDTLTMDNAYLFAFITYGTVPFIIICLATMYMIYYYSKRDGYMEVLLCLAIAIGGLTEPFLYNTSFKNLSFIFMGRLLFDTGKPAGEYGPALRWNRQVLLPVEGIERFGRVSKGIAELKMTKCFAGVGAALLLCLSVNLFVSYPEGYVFYRRDCADITKERNYYDSSNPEYADFKLMGEFEQGDEIEYFSGNIVKMEKVRNNTAAIVLGFFAGYTLAGVQSVIRGKNYVEQKQ